MKMAWALGWAIPVPWFARYVQAIFPKNTHFFFEPGSNIWEDLERESPFGALGGYSLGAQLLLENPERASRMAEKIALFAPIFGFSQEAGLGGKISRTQVRYLSRWLKRDRATALADFYLRSNLDVSSRLSDEISPSILEWGLNRLEIRAVSPPSPRDWKLYCGTNDSLLDGEYLAKIDSTVSLVPGATHHPEMLLRAWARALQE